MRVRPLLYLALAMTSVLQQVQAWDFQGHMMVAYLAFEHLDNATKAKVDRLLRLHPDYQTWVAGIPDDAAHQDQRLRQAMMLSATWPDQIKQDPHYTNDGENPSDPTASQNIGYDDHLQHRYWHYVDVPLSVGGVKGQAPAAVNAEERILLFLKTLQTPDPGSDPQLASRRSYDLVWLLHLMGDIHQPLHCTSRFTPTQPAGDQGGLKVNVQLLNGSTTTALHFYWDERLGTSSDPEVAIDAASHLPRVPNPTGTPDVAGWVHQSWQIAGKTVYSAPIGKDAGPYQLTARYDQRSLAVASQQIALAGARLAFVLTTMLQ